MKSKKFNKWIQNLLRFHHHDMHEELEEIKRLLGYVNGQMQELWGRIIELDKNTSMWMFKYDGIKRE